MSNKTRKENKYSAKSKSESQVFIFQLSFIRPVLNGYCFYALYILNIVIGGAI